MMRKHCNLWCGALLAGALIVAVSAARTHAQSDDIKSAREKVNAAAGALSKLAQDDGSESAEAKEIELKREALRKVVALTRTETESVYERLKALNDIESELVLLRDTLIDEIERYEAYLDTTEARLDALDTLEAVQQFAREFQHWRAADYNREIKKAIDMNLVGQNRAALRIADARFLKVSAYVKRVHSSHPKGSELEAMVNDAASRIRAARTAYSEARKLLAAYLPAKGDEKLTSTFAKGEEPASITDLVSESLQDIRDAYTLFLKIAKLVAG